jgi:RND family efflux transporter MFP subunit
MNDESSPAKAAGPGRGVLGKTLTLLFKGFLPLLVLVAAVVGAKQMIDHPPTTQRRTHNERQAALVETTEATVRNEPVVMEAMGTVVSSRQLQIKPEVSGRIVWLADNLVPGSAFDAGRPLIRLDRRDYDLALTQRHIELRQAKTAVTEAERSLIKARADLKLEMGNQAVARRELEVLAEEIDKQNRDLVLRRPQLEAAEAEVKAAEAALASIQAAVEAAEARVKSAELDLERTTILAPFDLVVENKLAELGDRVGTGSGVLEVIGSRTFWIQVSLPQADMRWVEVPLSDSAEPGSSVRIFNDAAWSQDQYRTGRVIRRLPTVDSRGHMARVLVAVDDPLSMASSLDSPPPLLAGSYVRVELIGRTLESVISLDRAWIRDGNSVWVMTRDGRLDIRPVQVLYRGRDHVLLRNGLGPGERIVTTDLPAPVPGMPLRTEKENSAQKSSADGKRAEAQP